MSRRSTCGYPAPCGRCEDADNPSARWSDNPAYAGRKPQPLTPACHDRSPMLDVECGDCGDVSHIHETQLANVPADADIGMRCATCRHVITFTHDELAAGFAELRKRGWIA